VTRVILQHRVIDARNLPVDVALIKSLGRPVGIAPSPRFRRPRWPYTTRAWSCYRMVNAIGGLVDVLKPTSNNVRLRLVSEGQRERSGVGIRTLLQPQSGTRRPVFREIQGLVDISKLKPRKDRTASVNKTIGYVSVDMFIVGAGLSGLSAALAAAASSDRLKILVVDEDSELGGVLGRVNSPSEANPSITSQELIKTLIEEIKEKSNITVWNNSLYLGYIGHGAHIVVKEEDILYLVKSKVVIYGMGGVEARPIFPNNDIPEVVSSSYILRLTTKYRYRPRRVAVIGWDSWALRVAGVLADAGSQVTIVSKAPLDKGLYYRYAAERGVELIMDRIEDVKREGDGVRVDFTTFESIKVDMIVSAVGYHPDIAPATAVGGRVKFSPSKLFYIPRYDSRFRIRDRMYIVGAGAAMYHEKATLISGKIAGLDAASKAGANVVEDIDYETLELYNVRDAADTLTDLKQAEAPIIVEDPPTFMAEAPGPNQFVDTCMDVTVLMIKEAVDSGLRTLEDVIAYTGLGEGPDQGRESVMNAIMVMSMLTKLPANKIGRPRFTLPLAPIVIGELAVGEAEG